MSSYSRSALTDTPVRRDRAPIVITVDCRPLPAIGEPSARTAPHCGSTADRNGPWGVSGRSQDAEPVVGAAQAAPLRQRVPHPVLLRHLLQRAPNRLGGERGRG